MMLKSKGLKIETARRGGGKEIKGNKTLELT